MIPVNSSLDEFVSELATDLSVDVCSLYRLTSDGQFLILEASHGLEQAVIGGRIPIDRGLCSRVVRTGKIVAVKEPENHPDYYHLAGSGEERYRTFLGIPIAGAKGDAVGVLAVQTKHSHMYLLHEVARVQETGRRIQALLAA